MSPGQSTERWIIATATSRFSAQFRWRRARTRVAHSRWCPAGLDHILNDTSTKGAQSDLIRRLGAQAMDLLRGEHPGVGHQALRITDFNNDEIHQFGQFGITER